MDNIIEKIKRHIPVFVVLTSIVLMGSTCGVKDPPDPIDLGPTCDCRVTQAICGEDENCIAGGCRNGGSGTLNGLCTAGVDGGGADDAMETMQP